MMLTQEYNSENSGGIEPVHWTRSKRSSISRERIAAAVEVIRAKQQQEDLRWERVLASSKARNNVTNEMYIMQEKAKATDKQREAARERLELKTAKINERHNIWARLKYTIF